VKLHPDGIAEGTPEECAAFKHIDAALAARNKPRLKAIEAAKPTKPTKAAPAKPKRAKTQRRSREEIAALNEQIIALAGAKDGVTADVVAQYLEMDRKRAYQMLYTLRGKQRLWLTDGGLFKAERSATV
jgi:hypothetical protein